ncbi:MAG: hypothetical protein HC925_07935 [Coleofasciculaceae cyanobacterium SM2_3_26]|nr:hypothetical protein [Coleofasciculaceae cyanobacterium SM2_3_26]
MTSLTGDFLNMGLLVALTVLFWGAIAAIQAWMVRRHLRSFRHQWIGLNVAGLALGAAVGMGAFQLLVGGLGLDVLQNPLHSGIAAVTPFVLFGAIASTAQWWVLRGRVKFAPLWAVANVILGLGIWGGTILTFPPANHPYLFGWVLLGMGAIASAATGRGMALSVKPPSDTDSTDRIDQ